MFISLNRVQGGKTAVDEPLRIDSDLYSDSRYGLQNFTSGKLPVFDNIDPYPTLIGSDITYGGLINFSSLISIFEVSQSVR